MTSPQTPLGQEAEQEVDLASAWGRLKARWWLPVGGFVAGAVVGLAFGLAGGQVWQAKTIVYLGQPFTPLGGGQIQSLATNPRTVSEIIHSESALKRASKVSGIPIAKLRTAISTAALTEAGQPRGISPLIEIAVKGQGRGKTELAAAALAKRVVRRVSVYVKAKEELLQSQIDQDKAQIDAATARIKAAQDEQAGLVTNRSLSAAEKFLVSSNLNSVIATSDAKRTSLQSDLYTQRQLLNLSTSVESGRVVEPASAAKTTARSTRTSLVVGALIGFILGVVAALVAEPIIAHRRRAASSDEA